MTTREQERASQAARAYRRMDPEQLVDVWVGGKWIRLTAEKLAEQHEKLAGEVDRGA